MTLSNEARRSVIETERAAVSAGTLIGRAIAGATSPYAVSRIIATVTKDNGDGTLDLDAGSEDSPQPMPNVRMTIGCRGVGVGDRVIVEVSGRVPKVTGVVSYNNDAYAPQSGLDEANKRIEAAEAAIEDLDVEKLDAKYATIENLKATNAVVGNLTADFGEFKDLTAERFEATEGSIEKLSVEKLSAEDANIKYATIDSLKAASADIESLKAEKLDADEAHIKFATVDSLKAATADIENLKTGKLDAEEADLKFATIENLKVTDAEIGNLKSDYGEFKQLTTDHLAASDADIERLDAEKASIKDLEAKYANIDFANIGSAAIENFLAKSGMIGDLVVGDGTVTGTLVGVTIKGDLIEGGTVKADKLVVQGEDGLYYKLNVSGETVGAEQTEYNSLSGSVITAKSITAEKVSVDDLVAFGATIGGFRITEDALYSGVKSSVGNATRGTYMDDDGQFAIGDGSNYLRFHKGADGAYRLDISAASIRFGSGGSTVEGELQDMAVDVRTEYYHSTSRTEPTGGSWGERAPAWAPGRYVWTRTKTVRRSGEVSYSEPACVSGDDGEDGEDAVLLQILSSNGNLFKNSDIATSLTVTIIVSGEAVTSSAGMRARFGEGARLRWEQKRFRETEFTEIDPSDPRLSDDGFIMTLEPKDVYTQTVFNCSLDY